MNDHCLVKYIVYVLLREDEKFKKNATGHNCNTYDRPYVKIFLWTSQVTEPKLHNDNTGNWMIMFCLWPWSGSKDKNGSPCDTLSHISLHKKQLFTNSPSLTTLPKLKPSWSWKELTSDCEHYYQPQRSRTSREWVIVV